MKRTRFEHILCVVAFCVFGASPTWGQSENGSTPADSDVTRSEPNAPRKWIPNATADATRLHETSGIVASRQYPGVFWTHGDSGNDPKLIAIDVEGRVLAEVMVSKAPNTDWEDICIDDQGNLYVGDIGNNHAMFPARYVYKIPEPDPHNPPTEAITASKRWRFKYLDKERFDCEALFWDGQSLYVMANLIPTKAVVYRLTEFRDGQMRLDQVADPRLAFPTGADVSSDGKHLVVSSYSAINVLEFERGDDSLITLSNKRTVRYPLKKGAIESVCFFGNDVIAMSEKGDLYRLTPEDFSEQVQFSEP